MSSLKAIKQETNYNCPNPSPYGDCDCGLVHDTIVTRIEREFDEDGNETTSESFRRFIDR
jgi:hypothetical protein